MYFVQVEILIAMNVYLWVYEFGIVWDGDLPLVSVTALSKQVVIKTAQSLHVCNVHLNLMSKYSIILGSGLKRAKYTQNHIFVSKWTQKYPGEM